MKKGKEKNKTTALFSKRKKKRKKENTKQPEAQQQKSKTLQRWMIVFNAKFVFKKEKKIVHLKFQNLLNIILMHKTRKLF